MLKVYIIFLLNLCWAIVSINGDCTLLLRNEIPLMVRMFGSRKIIVREKSQSDQQLTVGESVSLYCATSLELRADYTVHISEQQGVKSVEISCLKNSQLYYRDLFGSKDFNPGGIYNNLVVSCSLQTQQFLYESQKSLKNCQYMSYAIGTSIPNLKDVITAGICYDIDTLNFKFINYVAYHPKYEFVVNPPNVITDVDSVTLDKRLTKWSELFKFMSPGNFNNLLSEKKSQLPLLNAFEFDFESIIQQPSMRSVYEGYFDLLNIIWWRNLRLGNWKLFTDVVEQRATSVNYNIYLGVVGNISIPTTGCNNTETFTLKDNEVNVQAPTYVWAYLQALQSNVSEEFVVIGYNSPYYQTGGNEIFCKDMCNEINWLRNTLFSRVRLMPTMGVVFCCHPAEVVEKFDNFPYTLKPTDVVPSELRIFNNMLEFDNFTHNSAATNEPLMD